mmetsp:Transcript_3687/g.9441  ORF Transcript_3687/g.9441 Transcript_3687/m.9441 type:complete len:213 (-) Transcript_3687:100-738(-)
MEAIKELFEMQPPVTRCYIIASAFVMFLCSVDLVSPQLLYLDWQLIIYELQMWRLATCFLFNGTFGLSFFWNTYCLVMCCAQLEDAAFHRKTGDFLWMLLTTASMLLLLTVFLEEYFLSGAMVSVFVYLYSRRNSTARMQLMSVTIRAPYLPWAFAVVSLFTGGGIQDHLMGIAVGHVYYFFEDIYPLLPSSKGARVLQTPAFFKKCCNQRG